MTSPRVRRFTVLINGEDLDPCETKAQASSGKTDCCRSAVVRAFRELRGHDRPMPHAFQVALTVYRWHHPEVSLGRAEEIVSAWVMDGTQH